MKHVSINQFISRHRYTIKWKKQNSKVMWDLPKVLLPNPLVSFSAAGTGQHCPISSVSLTPCLLSEQMQISMLSANSQKAAHKSICHSYFKYILKTQQCNTVKFFIENFYNKKFLSLYIFLFSFLCLTWYFCIAEHDYSQISRDQTHICSW